MQQVNLYQPAVRKQWRLFSFQMTLSAALAMSVIFIVVYYFGYQDQQKMVFNLQITKLQEEDQLKRMEDLQAKLYPKRKTQQLEQKLELLKFERRQKSRVVSRLQDQTISNVIGFSPYFEALARQRLAELWLTKIRIHDGGEQMFLDGSVLTADLVPRYLQRLATETVYVGRVFQTFTLTRPENEAWHLDFSIGTKIEEGEPKR